MLVSYQQDLSDTCPVTVRIEIVSAEYSGFTMIYLNILAAPR